MTILLLEDENLVAKILLDLVRELEPQAQVFGPLASVREVSQWLHTHPPPELILADIQLSDGISFDVLQHYTQIPVIFTTAYDEYALRAFRVNSVDYLLKPIDSKELEAALQKFHRLQDKFSNIQFAESLRHLLRNFESAENYKQRFAVHSGRSVQLVPVQNVMYFVREAELIYLYDQHGLRYITDYRSLDEVEDLLDPAQFFRANRQYIVQLQYIQRFESDPIGKICLHLSHKASPEIVISKEKAASFRRWIG